MTGIPSCAALLALSFNSTPPPPPLPPEWWWEMGEVGDIGAAPDDIEDDDDADAALVVKREPDGWRERHVIIVKGDERNSDSIPVSLNP